jgi:hypothetical protein
MHGVLSGEHPIVDETIALQVAMDTEHQVGLARLGQLDQALCSLCGELGSGVCQPRLQKTVPDEEELHHGRLAAMDNIGEELHLLLGHPAGWHAAGKGSSLQT